MEGSGIDTDVVKLYDAFARYYREYSKTKSAYLSAVEEYVVRHIPDGAASLLDVGAGDGFRGMAIATKKEIARVILAEPSSAMAHRCRQLPATEVWHLSAEDLPPASTCFDVIICLWNVLGHINTRKRRLEALEKMRKLLDNQGCLFIDVNNRHNAAAYGGLRILGRRLIDFVCWDEKRGDASFRWQVGETVLTSMGHLFTPTEVEHLFKVSGLIVRDRISVNYATGRISRSVFNGQLLYTLAKQPKCR